MPAIRVLVVEDALTIRKYLVEVLASAPDIEVVGEAEDGKQGIELCARLRPDVVTMDMMMPVMTGLAATEYIMAYCPTPILIVSASTNRGELFKTYDALAAGAVDVLDKPPGDEANSVWENRFIGTVKLVSRIRTITHPRARLADRIRKQVENNPPPSTPSDNGKRMYRVVGIGASTGGPGAVIQILRTLPMSFRLPILLVVHMSESFGAAFADWLDSQTVRPVICAKDGQAVADLVGHVVLAPPNWHMTVRGGRLRLTQDPERHSCRPSVDILFESLAAEYGPSAATCLLTGMGRDGAVGTLAVRHAGGTTFAQDEASCVVYGMPREAVLLNAVDHVLPLTEISAALARLVVTKV